MRFVKHIVLLVVLLSMAVVVFAQRPSGGRIYVQGGRKWVNIDTLALDSAQCDSLKMFDSLLAKKDTLSKGQLFAERDSAVAKSLKRTFKERKPFNLLRDTISPGALVALSLVPGMGQVYNKQWWKAPIFYGLMGGFTAGGFVLNNQTRLATDRWQNAINTGADQSVIDQFSRDLRSKQTATTVMFALAGATYLYQLADATFNYRGKTNHIRKATTLAALFPGAGFIYTRTYWRLPIYYGGFAAIGTVIDYNNRSYVRYKRAWTQVVAGEPDEFKGRYDATTLKNATDAYRRDRDLGIICLAGAYILSIVDTYVIATLKNWDVTPDLSVTVTPTLFEEHLGQNSAIPSGAGLSLKVKF